MKSKAIFSLEGPQTLDYGCGPSFFDPSEKIVGACHRVTVTVVRVTVAGSNNCTVVTVTVILFRLGHSIDVTVTVRF
jgi:hypothetical protein